MVVTQLQGLHGGLPSSADDPLLVLTSEKEEGEETEWLQMTAVVAGLGGLYLFTKYMGTSSAYSA